MCGSRTTAWSSPVWRADNYKIEKVAWCVYRNGGTLHAFKTRIPFVPRICRSRHAGCNCSWALIHISFQTKSALYAIINTHGDRRIVVTYCLGEFLVILRPNEKWIMVPMIIKVHNRTAFCSACIIFKAEVCHEISKIREGVRAGCSLCTELTKYLNKCLEAGLARSTLW